MGISIGGALVVLSITIVSWFDAIKNDSALKDEFWGRFKKGSRLGILLAICGVGIGYANALQPGMEKVSIGQFVFVSLIGVILAILEIGALNGLNPNPENAKLPFFKQFVKFGWAVAIGFVGFSCVYLPYKLSLFIF